MYKILDNSPFGFVVEIKSETNYFSEGKYDVFVNDEFHGTYGENVFCVYGLKPNTLYSVCTKGLKCELNFDIKTENINYLLNVKDYNAFGDGVSNDTSAINSCIYVAPKGSTIYIPKGEYIVNEILLKSHVHIYLENGAILRQNTKRDEMAILKGFQRNYHHTKSSINTSWEGNPLDSYCSLIYGKDICDVKIFGEGTLNGNGKESGFWIDPKIKKNAFRPNNLHLVNCEGITVCGITSENSACWNLHPYYSKDIKFYGVTVKSIETSPNTDGLNPESSENIEIIGCKFSVGDDCIAIKSGKYFMSYYNYKPTKHVIIRNCYMESGHGGIVIGSEISCGVYDVNVTKCYFKNTDRGLRIKTRRGRGVKSIVDGISFNNVVMENVKHCFVINMFYNCDPDGKSEYVKSKEFMEVNEETPSIKNINLNNVVCKNISGSAVFIYGLPESEVNNVNIKNCEFVFSDERIMECPDMMDDFPAESEIDVFIKNSKEVYMDNILPMEEI